MIIIIQYYNDLIMVNRLVSSFLICIFLELSIHPVSLLIIIFTTGPLSSVVGLSSYPIDSSTVNITWSPPFTLPGTNIIGYNISVATNTSTVEAFTLNNYIEITVTTCIETDITVTGYNGLDGESNTISYPPTSNQNVNSCIHY